jgi:alkaline phosphatase
LGNQVFVERQAGLDSAAELQRAARLARERSARFFGLFGGDDGSVGPWLPEDAPGHPQLVPSTAEGPRLSEATRAALTVLSADPEGFFLMVEQGEIDWANHDADYRRMVGAVSDLDEAVRAVQQFVDRGGDEIDWNNTLLVVTADHATGYMRLDPSRLPELGDLPEQVARVREGQAEDEWPEYLYPQGEVTYATGKHTNELVRLYAIGAGMEAFTEREGRWYPGTRLIDNTQIFHALAAAAGAPRPERLSVVEGKAAARR